jgi:hypothetical protein
MPVILATQEAEIRRITVRSQSRQIICETLSQKKKKKLKRASGVAHGVALHSSLRTEKKKSCHLPSVSWRPRRAGNISPVQGRRQKMPQLGNRQADGMIPSYPSCCSIRASNRWGDPPTHIQKNNPLPSLQKLHRHMGATSTKHLGTLWSSQVDT